VGNGKHIILLNENQAKKINKSIKLKKRVELELDYEQLRINHSGGFLPLLLVVLGPLLVGAAAVENSVIDTKQKC
jgi:hypothetical protein